MKRSKSKLNKITNLFKTHIPPHIRHTTPLPPIHTVISVEIGLTIKSFLGANVAKDANTYIHVDSEVVEIMLNLG